MKEKKREKIRSEGDEKIDKEKEGGIRKKSKSKRRREKEIKVNL